MTPTPSKSLIPFRPADAERAGRLMRGVRAWDDPSTAASAAGEFHCSPRPQRSMTSSGTALVGSGHTLPVPDAAELVAAIASGPTS